MAKTSNILDFQEKVIKNLGLKWHQIKMCELGSQYIIKRKMSGKIYYTEEKKVLEHTSLDLNGMFGSLKVNLCLPVPKGLLNRFSLITDYGTIEHVNNQYQVFRNAHEMCKVNGVMIHVLPIPSQWPNHCRYYYPKEFFIGLSKSYNYKILSLEIKNAFSPPIPKKNLIFVAFLKCKENEFITKNSFKSLKIIDTKDINKTGNYFIRNQRISKLRNLTNKLELYIPGKKYIIKTFQRVYLYIKNY